jgi:hypothetical protein
VDNEKIYDVYWEGPFEWDGRDKKIRDHHVLYQIYGFHHAYGREVLLYVGSSGRSLKERLKEHEEWLEDEYDKVTLRFGSVGEFTNWKGWDTDEDYKKANGELVERIEALLIYAHQPAYNQASKSQAMRAKGIRIFNSGRLGQLFPEVSYKYFLSEFE